ncbi:MAG: phospho-sugar mutase [Desulfitobacteriaceae bacterium]|nr:phospho-sugar mutase [Desulfitobacteriaceae bacterium]MDD4345968.1 phospho-sugar mutase [Desulfitobacteriaceae bacterium]MDD4400999.1 phospho-sugar mutase [Desulfitobacteriaceae bacterium]
MHEKRFKLWSEHPYFDTEFRQELKKISDPKEIEDRFYTDLEFGTGGLRGIIAAGTNRINKYVIRKVTHGLAEYIINYCPEDKQRGVVIAYDSRRFSREFALEAALVLAQHRIRAFLFDALRPTPELSFAVRNLHALAGIVITASHNPKEYNGYKLYWEDGGQVPPEQADCILAYIKKHESWVDIKLMSQEEALASGLLVMIGAEIDREYLDKVKSLTLNPQIIKENGSLLKIVYSPLHGAGNILVRKALSELGFSDVIVVAEQEHPDPEFSTVSSPNPEIPSAFDLAKQYGLQTGADLLIATDPDSDRLGVAVWDNQGQYQLLSGNQIGVLLIDYILSQKNKSGMLPDKATIIKTIASSDLADEVARSYGAAVENVLTGFKFIAEKEKELEENNSGVFQFGFEESYGYLAGDFVRDKDAVIAAVLIAEAALFYKFTKSFTLIQVLDEIYSQFGYYLEDQESIVLKGKSGLEKMAQIMTGLREADLSELGGIPIEKIDDYERRSGKLLDNNFSYPLELPRSNVLRFSFKDGGFVMARPSGTEPKIKFYFSVKGQDKLHLVEIMKQVKSEVLAIVNKILAWDNR